MPSYKYDRLPPRSKLYGYDYNKSQQLRMTGREWSQYTKREKFKFEHGNDTAWSGNGVEVWLDGTKMEANNHG